MAEGIVDIRAAQESRRRELLRTIEKWSPEEALEAMLLDIRLGRIKASALCVVIEQDLTPEGSEVAEHTIHVASATGARHNHKLHLAGLLHSASILMSDV